MIYQDYLSEFEWMEALIHSLRFNQAASGGTTPESTTYKASAHVGAKFSELVVSMILFVNRYFCFRWMLE